jgi:hypothetical protein
MYGDEHKGKSLSAAAEVEDVNDVRSSTCFLGLLNCLTDHLFAYGPHQDSVVIIDGLTKVGIGSPCRAALAPKTDASSRLTTSGLVRVLASHVRWR